MTDNSLGVSPGAGEAASKQDTIATDLLRGANAIAHFIFGDATQRRKVYHLAQIGRLPVFKMGSTLCARRSTLLRWIERLEAQTSGTHD